MSLEEPSSSSHNPSELSLNSDIPNSLASEKGWITLKWLKIKIHLAGLIYILIPKFTLLICAIQVRILISIIALYVNNTLTKGGFKFGR